MNEISTATNSSYSSWPVIKNAILAVDDNYSHDAQIFVNFLEQREKNLTYQTLKDYAEWLDQDHEGKRWSASTYNKRLIAAKHRVRLLFDNSDLAFDVVEKYKLEKALSELKLKKINSTAVSREKILTPEEIQILISELRNNIIPGGTSTSYIVEFLSVTGTRISEALNILLTDIKKGRKNSTIRILGKGNKERLIMVDIGLIQTIRSHFKGSNFLFEHNGNTFNPKYITNQIRIAGQICFGKRISAHTLRHSFATNMLQKTNNLKGVSTFLGHSSTSITADLYVHSELSWEDIAQ